MKRKAIKLISWSKRAIALTLSALVLISSPSCASKQIQSSEELNDEEVFVANPIRPPQFKGGYEAWEKFIAKHLNYPKEAIKQGIQGRVCIGATIKKNGSISKIKVIRGVHPLLDKEAIRLVKSMPKFTPAKDFDLGGKSIESSVILPIVFRLPIISKARKSTSK